MRSKPDEFIDMANTTEINRTHIVLALVLDANLLLLPSLLLLDASVNTLLEIKKKGKNINGT